MDTTKRFLVSFLVIASILVMTSMASATSIVSFNSVKVNGLEVYAGGYNAAVLSGNTIPVTVTFTANENESNVRLSGELQGFTTDISKEILVGDVEAGRTYTRTIDLVVPSSMADVQSDNINLVLNVWNGDSSVSQTTATIPLRQQRQAYNAQIMSLSTLNSAKAGDIIPVSVVVKNTGYSELNDLYATVSLPALKVQRTAYLGDINNAVGNNDTVSGVVYLQIPYDAPQGTYTVQADVRNSNFEGTGTTLISVQNQFQNNIVASSYKMTANVGSDASYSLTIVNPTSSISLYRIVPDNTSDLSVSVDSLVTVPAGSSKTVTLTASAESSGTHNFNVNVFSGSQLTGQAALTLTATSGVSNPVAILTIVLAVIFVVLVVVMIVLVTKRPTKKQEDFGESYY